jgi:asparagine synthase (glutamine-hydrolysing)
LRRDPLGVAPIYYGRTGEGHLCFASEVKALKNLAREIHELPPGHTYDGERLEAYFRLEPREPLDSPPEAVAAELRRRLEASVEGRVSTEEMGSWLSGGLDSSTLAALACRRVKRLFTFAAGVPGAPDLEYASEVARHIGAEHHQVTVGLRDMLEALPKVIEHLESFDALLVRSSVTNYLVAKRASDFVPQVFSGEAGDELFAGYAYLKSLDRSALAGELIDITARLHNTAFQRVDRSASAHGTVPHVAFADPAVVDFALRIPIEYKLREGIEKWILRRAMEGALPKRVLDRTKAKFWEGAGVGEQLSDHAGERITDDDFRRERTLPGGLKLRTKEELMYYRIFRDVLGIFEDLTWMGRTKGAPET